MKAPKFKDHAERIRRDVRIEKAAAKAVQTSADAFCIEMAPEVKAEFTGNVARALKAERRRAIREAAEIVRKHARCYTSGKLVSIYIPHTILHLLKETRSNG